MLDTAGVTSLRGAACLEFGSGHLLTEPLLQHLLGAKRAVAVDYFPILQPGPVAVACRGVDEDALAGALGGLEEAELLRSRFRALATRQDWSLSALAGLGIAYVAPYDAAAGPLPGGERFDLIASCSVLEHVPREAAGAILRNLAAMLKPGGVMVHAIHLEDHRDFARAPFAFLAADTDWTGADADRRGNRLRARDWVALAQGVPGVEIAAAETEIRDVALPARLDAALAGYKPDELRVKRLVLALRAPAGQMGA
jgi:SAM-dependent methyltransferase